MKKQPLLAILGIFLATIATASGVAYQFRPDVPPVTDARSLFSLSGNPAHYWWLDDQTLLLLHDPSHPSFTRRKIGTGQETAIPPLNKLFLETTGKPESLRVARDGEYLLWTSQDQMRTIVCRSDGSEHHEISHLVPSIALWSADGKSFSILEIRSKRLGLTRTFSREKPDSNTRYMPLSISPPTDSDQSNLARAAITTSGQFLIQSWNGPDQSMARATLVAASFVANPMFTRDFSFPVPHENQGGEVFFAPAQYQMGWQLRFLQPLEAAIQDATKPTKKFYTGFWITNLQTRKTIMLGCLETTRDDANSGPFNVQFTPSGENISYVYKNSLWLLPINYK